MYSTLLTAHSWLRWAVVLLGVFALLRAIAGWTGRKRWTAADDRVGLFLTIAVDLQLLLGLTLYFLSPFSSAALDDFGAAMRNPELRFWGVEHAFGALVGIILIHIGRVRVRKTSDDTRRHKLSAIFFGIAMVAILVSVPWPGTPHARPLIPR